MYHFFVEKENIDKENHRVYIDGGDYNHIRNVLRMHPGEEISVGTGEDEDEYRCAVDSFEEDRVVCKLLFVKASGVESPAEIVLFQGLPKADKMELIVQKCTELGVAEIVPVSCKRSVVKLDAKKSGAKIARWQGIAEAAAKQSKRAVIPKVSDLMTVKEAVKYAEGMEIAMIPYELAEGMKNTKDLFEKLRKAVEEKNSAKGENKVRVAIFIGPEGGFEEEEVALAKEAGIVPVSLGKRILRTETAGFTVLSWINYILEVEGTE